MWLALLVLFVVLSPGVLFTLPALGKKMGGKFVIALMHSLLFVVVVALLNVTEAFQVGVPRKVAPKFTPEQTLRMAEQSLQRNIDTLARLKESVVRVTQQIESNNSQVNELRQQLATVQAANLAAQEKVNERNAALSDAQKEVLDTTTNMNMITNKISSLTRRVGMTKSGVINRTLPEQQLIGLNNSINSTTAAITRSQNAVNAAKLAMNASNTVQKVAEAPASMDSGSKVQDVAQATEVARTAQVDAEKAVIVANKAPVDATPATPPASGTPTIASMLGLGPKTITMLGDKSPTPPPPQRMPADLCPTGSWPLMYNGSNDGTGQNSYTSVCTPCSTPYPGNPNIPVNINQQNYANYKYTC